MAVSNFLFKKVFSKLLNVNCFRFCSYERVTPGFVSPIRSVPNDIEVPKQSSIKEPQIRSINDMVRIRQSCQTARRVLDFASQLVQVGVTTEEIDMAVHERCLAFGVYPSPLTYRGFPKSICTSVNNVVCHGIPDDRPLQDGDIINLDVTVFQNGFHGDCSRTFVVGSVDEMGVKLVDAADACLLAGISVCADGRPLSDIGEAVEQEASQRGFSIIPAVAGHGIGRQFHEPPDVYHFVFVHTCWIRTGNGEDNHDSNSYLSSHHKVLLDPTIDMLAKNSGAPDCGIMRAGMTFTIEPALAEGGIDIVVLEDGWTAVTADGTRSAQAEHTIHITETGAEILTTF